MYVCVWVVGLRQVPVEDRGGPWIPGARKPVVVNAKK